MMLQIDHRESRDVDIFLTDPQLLAFLDPERRDFQYEIQPDGYEGDGARFLKLAFDKLGEIDFIVASAMSQSSPIPMTVEGENVLLDSVPEIIVKKICHRGSSIKPRDIFDIAAAGEQHEHSLVAELRGYSDEAKKTVEAIDRLNADFVNRAIAQLAIKDRYKEVAKVAIERSKEILRTV